LDDALDRVQEVIGDERSTGLTDQEIRDVLWDNFFDVERTIQWALGVYESLHYRTTH
jgi:elongation factor 1 alpha-like protein